MSALSMTRLKSLLRVELAGLRKTLYITLACVAGLAFIRIALFNMFHPVREGDFHESFLGTVLFIGGGVFASMAFRELKETSRAITYMLLPSSLLEKYLVKLFVVSLGYIVALYGAYFVGATLGELLLFAVRGKVLGFFNPFALSSVKMAGGYIMFMSFFLFGAVRFESYHFFKTLLALIIIGILNALLAAVVFRITFNSYFDGVFMLKPTYVHMAFMADHLSLGGNSGLTCCPPWGTWGLRSFTTSPRLCSWWLPTSG